VEDLYLIVKGIIDPLFIVFILLLAAFIFCLIGRKKNGALILFFSIILLYGISIVPTANYLSYHLERDYINKQAAADKKKIDAIVVLAGGSYDINSMKKTFPSDSSIARLIFAVEIYQKNGARYFVCAGKGTGKISEAEVIAQKAEGLGVPKEKIRMDVKSQSTWEHAVALSKMFPDKNIVLGLVSSAYHLRRSEKEFKKYFSHVMPLPADYLYSSPAGTRALRFIPQTESLVKTKIALHEIFGQWWYWIKS
jgi:uncharacterized SAM-binding protein YcdF (DUF218 family)